MDSALSRPHTRLHSLLWILCSTLLISGSAIIAHTIYQTISEKRPYDTRYTLRAIIQPEERLSAGFIAGLLNLPEGTNLYTVDTQEAEKRLLACSLIRTARVKRAPPDALYIDLTLRTPYARLADRPGMAVDLEGVVFPCSAPFTGPTLRLEAGDPLPALQLFQALPEISFVDVSRLAHPRFALREITVGLENGTLLRLPPTDYEKALANYQRLHLEGPHIIDLRLPKAAYYQRIQS